jgi:hypothetical protein
MVQPSAVQTVDVSYRNVARVLTKQVSNEPSVIFWYQSY